jgi:hypothetical protein
MIMMVFTGKALLVITRNEDVSGYHWDITPYIQSINTDDPGGEVNEAFYFIMSHDYHPAPAAAYRMDVGDTIRVAVTFELHFSRDYWGECDSDLYLTKERVLRKQPYNEKKYRKNFYKFWRTSRNV